MIVTLRLCEVKNSPRNWTPLARHIGLPQALRKLGDSDDGVNKINNIRLKFPLL